jgi:uncharacterized protein
MSTLIRFITPIALAMSLVFNASPSGAQAQDGASRSDQTQTLNVGIHNIQVELAQTEQARAVGLMNRPNLGAHQGMLFVFDSAAAHCFWMKNTLIPLSIAFLADDGRIVHIDDMQPQSLVSHCPPKPISLALEMNQGWFAKRGIKIGMKISGAIFKNSPAR